MQKKAAALSLALPILCLALPGCKREEPSSPAASPKTPPAESRPRTYTLSGGRVVSESLVARIDSSSLKNGYGTVSPDSKRAAYAAIVGNKQFVIVDGKEEKKYDDIRKRTLTFNPDSKRFAYVAAARNKQLVVVDGKEGTRYDDMAPGSAVIFDSPNSLHYLALKGNNIYLVEETIE